MLFRFIASAFNFIIRFFGFGAPVIPPATFILYNSNVENFNLTNTNLTAINLDEPTIFCIHGWLSDPESMQDINEQILLQGGYNVISVNWNELATREYVFAASLVNTRIVATIVTELVIALYTAGYPLTDIHLVGHSLGAHICGFVGQNVLTQTGQLVGRITGLDPAGPGFVAVGDDNRLSADDAQFVDVTHTAIGLIGIIETIGRVDFYVNGGTPSQPGCFGQDILTLTACSHSRAIAFFAESVSSNNFLATNCTVILLPYLIFCDDSEPIIYGFNINTTEEGAYFFDTNAEPPYALSTPLITSQ